MAVSRASYFELANNLNVVLQAPISIPGQFDWLFL